MIDFRMIDYAAPLLISRVGKISRLNKYVYTFDILYYKTVELKENATAIWEP